MTDVIQLSTCDCCGKERWLLTENEGRNVCVKCGVRGVVNTLTALTPGSSEPFRDCPDCTVSESDGETVVALCEGHAELLREFEEEYE